MPLIQTHHPFPDTSFGLWHIDEEEAFFRTKLPLSEAEKAELALHQYPIRRLEWLAGRWLLHQLSESDERLPLAKDAFSKPFFPENQDLSCSLSHSKGSVAAYLLTQKNKEKPTRMGCDIQVMTEKMKRVSLKFLRPEEKNWVESRPDLNELELLHLFWSAKESLYKAHGMKQLDFRAHISVENIDWDGFQGAGLGRVEKGDFKEAFHLSFGKIMLPDGTPLIWAACKGT